MSISGGRDREVIRRDRADWDLGRGLARSAEVSRSASRDRRHLVRGGVRVSVRVWVRLRLRVRLRVRVRVRARVRVRVRVRRLVDLVQEERAVPVLPRPRWAACAIDVCPAAAALAVGHVYGDDALQPHEVTVQGEAHTCE